MGRSVTIWTGPDNKLEAAIDEIAASANTYARWSGGSSTHPGEVPSYNRFVRITEETEFKVIFGADGTSLRYESSISKGRKVLAAGPSGVIEIPDGLELAANEIAAAFDAIIAFVQANRKLLTEDEHPLSSWPFNLNFPSN